MRHILLTLIILSILSGCSGCTWYKAKDTMSDGTTTLTKESSAVGIGKPVSAPIHKESKIENGITTLGGTDYEIDEKSGLYLLYWFGGIAVIAGIVGGVFFKRYYLGAAVAAAGLCLIMVATYSWVLLVVPVLGLAAGIWFVFDSRRRKIVLEKLGLTSKTLKQTVAGIQVIKTKIPDSKDEINTALAGKQDLDAQALVKDIKWTT